MDEEAATSSPCAESTVPAAGHATGASARGGEAKAICLVGAACDNAPLRTAIETHYAAMPVYECPRSDGLEHKHVPGIVHVVAEFDGSAEFQYLNAAQCTILGPTVVLEHAECRLPLPYPRRPLYCGAMRHVTACISGLSTSSQINRLMQLIDLIHWMGGHVRRELTVKQNRVIVTHVISTSTQTHKYSSAIALALPVMDVSWPRASWDRRHTPFANAISNDFAQSYRLKCFHGLRLSFRGFDDAEMQDVAKHTAENGGKVVPEGSDSTHLVVYNSAGVDGPIYKPNDACKVVDVEWFWLSVERDHCVTESLYAVPDGRAPPAAPAASQSSAVGKPSLPYPLSECSNSQSTGRLSAGAKADGGGARQAPRRSRLSADLLGRRSTDSVLEKSSDMSGVLPDHLFSTDDVEALSASPCKSLSEPKLTKRYQVCCELLQTERNYVHVLSTIVKVFKEPLEEVQEPPMTPVSASATLHHGQQRHAALPVLDASDTGRCSATLPLTPGARSTHGGGAFNFTTPAAVGLSATPGVPRELLSKQETQLIFGKIPAILEVHNKILEELDALMKNWNETNQVGSVWLRVAGELEKCYPHFVNNFDKAKETLVQCDRSRSKFHAFLKLRQSRAECQRQSLQELLIRPVQRLPSVTLLLNDILKATDKFNPDHEQLVRALDAIKNALNTVNDNKRATEARIRIFEIFRDIECFPEQLISAQRSFLGSLDAIDLDGQVSGRKGRHVTFFLFNDFVEVAKRRTKALKTVAGGGPSSAAAGGGGAELGEFRPAAARQHGKMHKHIADYSLTAVRRIGDVAVFSDTEQLFALTIRTEMSEDEHIFLAETSDAREKRHFLKLVANQIISTGGRGELPIGDVQLADDAAAAVAKQLKSVVGTRAGRLSRALSLSKVSGGNLRRTVSSMAVGFGGTLARMSHSRLPMASAVLEERDENTPPAGAAGADAAADRRQSLGIKCHNTPTAMAPPHTPHAAAGGRHAFGRRLSFMGTLKRASSRLAMGAAQHVSSAVLHTSSSAFDDSSAANSSSYQGDTSCISVATNRSAAKATAGLQSCNEADI